MLLWVKPSCHSGSAFDSFEEIEFPAAVSGEVAGASLYSTWFCGILLGTTGLDGVIPMQSGNKQQRKSSQSFKRKELVGKLDPTCQRAFKAAADAAKLRGNPYVELAHWIEQLVLSERSDVQLILAEAGAEAGRLAGDMTRALDKLPRGATAIEEFSDHIFHAIQEAWSLAPCSSAPRRCAAATSCSPASRRLPSRGARLQSQRRVRQGGRRRHGRPVRRGRLPPRWRAAAGGTGRGRSRDAAPAATRRSRRYATDLTAARPRRQDRPRRRPRPGDPPDHRRPDAAAAEQPDPHRRGGRRQDGGGRRLRAADRAGRRAAAAAERRACTCWTSG